MSDFAGRKHVKHIHPVSGKEKEGTRLSPGTVTQEGDVYDSTDGTWRALPCPGSTVSEGSEAIIVRPEDKS